MVDSCLGVAANKVYQEYISDKNHIHMNATAWSSLAGLCRYLGREGRCVVEETDKGWYIQWIDRDPKTLEKQAKLEQRQKAELDDEERMKMLIDSQIAAGVSVAGSEEEQNMEEESFTLKRDENQPRLEISLGLAHRSEKSKQTALLPIRSEYFVDDDTVEPETAAVSRSSHVPAIEQLKVAEEKRKQREIEALDKRDRLDHWLRVGLIVKIVNKTVGDGTYYRQKGEIVAVMDKYIADVKVEGLALLRLDQDDLETVLPRPGNKVVIVNGRGRGSRATLLSINETEFNCDVRVDEGILAGREIKGVDYEDVCRFVNI